MSSETEDSDVLLGAIKIRCEHGRDENNLGTRITCWPVVVKTRRREVFPIGEIQRAENLHGSLVRRDGPVIQKERDRFEFTKRKLRFTSGKQKDST